MNTRTALLLAAAVAVTATAATVALKAGSWDLAVSRNAIRLSPLPRPGCPDCRGEGGWWSEGPYPGGELCWCWDRPTRTLRLLPVRDPWPDEPPF
ncbi:hypothetical protein [Streptomyces sp. S1D4-14]|uniref:hypothetical protein n=1 Tax=Streptomyces sp. S1D4-14 TaxID=2594461 RepID=UPI001165B746|nr:hypothetical protein [Streptomyces sp. S1D4-14]QDN64305.1 hypothetical protein FNV66_00310 [Streptomyces sp. S1D4-14]